jgi:ADP-L-glycero-D-manno-heptose 6-epimerase
MSCSRIENTAYIGGIVADFKRCLCPHVTRHIWKMAFRVCIELANNKDTARSMLVVTGAAGFIGSNLIARLNRSAHQPLVGVDWVDSDRKAANVSDLQHITWAEPENLHDLLSATTHRISGIIHLGAETSTTATDRKAVFATNVAYSQMLWNWCAAQSVPFIYASSASVYGDGSEGFQSHLSSLAMKHLRPLNIYGESKLAFDQFVAERVETSAPTPPQWAGLRFFNVYGSRERHKGSQASVVTQMYPVAARGESYALFKSHRNGIADGEQKRDFVFVDDCCEVITWLLANSPVSGLFNVGTGHACTFLDMAKAVYRATDRPLAVTWRDTPLHLQAHYQYFTEADLTTLRSAGYARPFTSLEDGVTMTVNRYKMQQSAAVTT